MVLYSIPIENTGDSSHTPIYKSIIENKKDCINCWTLYDNFNYGYQGFPNNPCLGRIVDGVYCWQTYEEVYEMVLKLGTNLLEYVKPQYANGNISFKNFVGIYAPNSVEWATIDLACSFYSLISVSIYDSLSIEGIEEILKQTRLTILFTSLDRLKIIDKLSSTYELNTIILMDCKEVPADLKINGPKLFSWNSFNNNYSVQRIPIKPLKDMVATICYTSGTTGIPKGAVLTHLNIMSVMLSAQNSGIVLKENDCHLSYLPMAHMFERIVQTAAYFGSSRIGFSRGDPKLILDDIKLLCPTIFPSVPRLYNRIYDMILKTIRQKGNLAQILFNLGYNLGQMYSPWVNSILGRTIFRRIRKALGGKVRLMITGSAPIQPEVLEFMRVCFGCPVIEGYGQTETAAGVSLTRLDDFTVGHVGGPLTCCEIRLESVEEMNYLAKDKKGEICYRGNNIFKGYYGNTDLEYGIDPIKTADAIDRDGWLHSGDIGEILPNGAIKIIDRKKNIFKLSQGEYIAPEKLENIYSLCPDIQQVFIYGDSLQSSLVALVISEKSEEEILEQMKTIGRVQGLKGLEIPSAVSKLSEPMTVENGMLTPTFKFKRHEISKKYRELINSLYDGAK